MNRPQLSENSNVYLKNLVIHQEGDEFIVGVKGSDNFIKLPKVGVDVINELKVTPNLNICHKNLQQCYKQEIDVKDFIETLLDLSFVKQIDDFKITKKDENDLTPGEAKVEFAHKLFSAPCKILYALIVGTGLYLLLFKLNWIPSKNDFFWSNKSSLVLLLNTIIFILCLLAHEYMHLLAAYSRGIGGKIEFSTRLHNLVLQANVTGLWGVDRTKRYRVYFAGITSDLFIISLCSLVLYFELVSGVVAGILKAIILMNFLGIAFQFNFYMRTDLYFVLMDALKIPNLYQNAILYLKSLWKGFLGSAKCFELKLTDHTPREIFYIKLYALFVLGGSLWALSMALVFGLPILMEMYYLAFVNLSDGFRANNGGLILDGIITFLVEGGLNLLFLYTFFKKYAPALHRKVSQLQP